MAGPIITQCPKCGTSFRVTESQLSAAKGAVRCGACLHVFNAIKHSKGPAPVEAAASSAPDPATPPQKPVTEISSNAAEPENDEPEERFGDDSSIEEEEDNVIGLQSTQPESKDVEVDFEFDESFLGLQAGQALSDPFEEEEDTNDTRSDDEEDWANALLSDEEEVSIEVEPITAPVAPPPSTTPSKKRKKPESEFNLELIDEDVPPAEESTSRKKKKGFFSKKSEQNDESTPRHPVPPIEDEPLSLSHHFDGKSKKLGFIWFFVALILVGALGGQYVFYNFYELSKTPKYRPYMEWVCAIAGCNLPSKVAVHEIKTTTTPRVRKHPTRDDALVVDILMINKAAFQQPFPQIEILFSDHQQKPVASRRFMPAEYLKGELAGITMMPIEKEIHVRFEILDPGPKAINYKVTFWPLNY